MKIKKAIKQITKVSFVFCLIVQLIATPIIPAFQTPISPKIAEAAGESCSGGGGSPTGSNLQARVGGVALDQAATFLADMSDITGAYYDSALDRIVFVGKTNTSLPKFDKDDLAVAIKAVIFNKTIPALSIENDPANPGGSYQKVLYYGGIEDTQFGKVLFDADWALKKYVIGYDENQQPVTSLVAGYKSQLDRYLEIGPDPNQANNSGSRFWITPDIVSLKKDDNASSFVFDQVKMKVNVEYANPNNDPAFNQSMTDFVQHHTDHFDEFANETPAYADTKQLGKIVAVIKWLNDKNIPSDFNWARDYAPKYISTPRQTVRLTSPQKILSGKWYQMSGGVEYTTKNTYNPDDGTSSALKNASEAVSIPKEEIHWTFVKDGQSYESVAVAADAFRSLGSYNTTVADMSFPAAGDLSLTFARSYSSYSGGQNGIGRGWNIIPARLYDNNPHSPATIATCPSTGVSHLWKLGLDTSEGGHETFTFATCAGYSADDSSYHTKLTASDDNSQFIATIKNQTQYIFDQNLRLKQIKDKNGNTISYNYDGTGKLASIADSKNHQITLNYSTVNGQTLISSISDWSGRTVSYSYDDNGNLLTVTDPKGNITTYTYDTNYKLTSITDREGKKVTENTYTPEAKLATQKDAADLTNTYSHDDANKTITILDNLGRSQKAVYDEKARILQQIDPLNKAVTYTYGTELAPLTVTDKNANKTIFTYDASGNLTSVTYPDTKKVTYEFDTKNRITRILDYRYGTIPKETKYTYNTPGDLTQTSEAGLLTKYTYDTTGEILTLTDPLNHITTWTRDTFGNKLTEKNALNNTATFEYDTTGRLNKTTDPDTKVISYTYDNNGNLLTQTNSAGTTTNIYDKENRLTKTTLPNSSVTEYVYNDSGALNSVKDALANNTNYGYDAYQNLTTQQDALNNTTTNIYDQLNRQTQSTTPLGKVSKWEYDANGNITKRIDANNNTTNYQYDSFNRLTKITYPDTKTVTYTYDNRGNRTKMIDPTGTSTYTYDKFDRLTQAKNPFNQTLSYTYNNADLMTKITYPDGKAVTYAYDNNNKLTKTTDWNYNATSYTYNKNGTLSTKTLPNGIITTYSYDNANRLIGINHKKSTTTLADFVYERDNIGNITKASEQGTFLLQPSPVPTSTPTPTPTPTSGATTPTPTPSTTGADLVITNVTFTPANPQPNQFFTITTTIKNQGTSRAYAPVSKITYYYDYPLPPTYDTGYSDFNNITIDLGPGETMQEVNNYASFTTTGNHQFYVMIDQDKYIAESDENNNLYGPVNVTLNAPTPTPTGGPTSIPTPTPAGSQPDLVVSSISLNPSTVTAGNNFDVVVKVKNQGTAATATYFKTGLYYDRPSAPAASTYNDSETYLSNIAVNQEITLTEPFVEFADAGAHNIWVIVDREGVISESNETNNVFGPYNVNVLAMGPLDRIFALFRPSQAHAQIIPPFTTTFSYDLIGRLTSAIYPDNSLYSYTFDKVGNRLTLDKNGQISNYTYNTDNQLQQGGNKTYYYDNNGNQTMTAETSPLQNPQYSYDFENRLIQYVMPNGNTHNFKYDGLGNRLEKEFSTAIIRWTYDNSGSLSKLMANSYGDKYVYGLNLLSQGGDSSSSRQYFLEDGLGNTRFVTDSSGNKKKAYEYDPYGNIRAEDGIYDSIFQFQSQQYDDTLGLYFLRARYYDPATGRFISRDPIKGYLNDPRTQNGYDYALNNPINLSDPTGNIPLLLAIGVSGAVGATANMVSAYANNPCITPGELAMAGGKGFVVGAVAGGAALATGAVAGMAGAGVFVSNVAGGVASGIVGNTADNALNNQPLGNNFAQSAILGGVTGGTAGSAANVIAPVGQGRPSAATLIQGGVKSMRELDNHSVSEGINALLCGNNLCR